LIRALSKSADSGTRKKALRGLIYARSACNAQQSFAKKFNYSYGRGKADNDLSDNDTISEDQQSEMLEFLLDVRHI
jgi:hypothetical protein